MYYQRIFLTFSLALVFVITPFAAFTKTESPELLYQKTRNWQLPYKPIDLVQSADGNMIFILTENSRVLIYEANGKLKGSIPVDSGVTRIGTDIRGESILLVDGEKNTFTSLSFDFIMDIDIADSPFQGSAEAPVTISVFTNFQCPYCSQLEPILKQVLEKNRDKVKIVFKHMSLRGRNLSDVATLASFAAGNQGKFWEFHDEVFATENLTEQSFDEIAKKLGLDIAKLKADMNSPEIQQKLNKDTKDAQAAGVRGTPTVFINGEKLKNRSPNGFQTIIDKELAKTK